MLDGRRRVTVNKIVLFTLAGPFQKVKKVPKGKCTVCWDLLVFCKSNTILFFFIHKLNTTCWRGKGFGSDVDTLHLTRYWKHVVKSLEIRACAPKERLWIRVWITATLPSVVEQGRLGWASQSLLLWATCK